MFAELQELLVPELVQVVLADGKAGSRAVRSQISHAWQTDMAIEESLHDVQEIRLRIDKPVRLRLHEGERELPLRWDNKLQERQLMLFMHNSVYAYEEQLRQGFISLPGGHRVGLVGEAWYSGGELKGFKHIASLNLRLARAVVGAAKPFWDYLLAGRKVMRTLLAAPPGVGKTTLLRDIVRGLAEGAAGIPPLNIGLADERMEIAAAYEGRAQLDVGSRCDVISACPKAEAIMILLRTMGPQVIVCDEIGSQEDSQALAAALNAGVAVLASAHGASREELLARPWLGRLIAQGYFERLIMLDRAGGRLLPKAVYDAKGGALPC